MVGIHNPLSTRRQLGGAQALRAAVLMWVPRRQGRVMGEPQRIARHH